MTNNIHASPPPNPPISGYTRLIMKCSIVIRAYNESRHLGRLLEGIERQTQKGVEVILVDSGSSDHTVGVAESHGARVVHIRPEEFTFGRSLNLGIQAAASELIVIASAHVYPVYPDWLECLLRPFENPTIALVYGKQRGTASSSFSERQIFRQWFPDADAIPQRSPFCNNANAAIRRSLWETHPYDESLTGLEDLAWAKWAQAQGRELAYAAHAEIVHVHNESSRGVYDRYRREAMAFKRIFPESHFSAYDCLRLIAANAASDLYQAAREQVLLKSAFSIAGFRSIQFWGTYQGYRHSGAVTQELRQRFYYPPGIDGVGTRSRDMEPIRYNEASPRQESGDRKRA